MDSKEYISILRGLLISRNTVLKANTLLRDYEELEGRPFPFRQLGFSSFVDFLRSIPSDVKLIPPNGYNPDVLPIASEESRHIEELVLKQKRPPTRGRRGVGRRRVCHGSINRGQHRQPSAPAPVPSSNYQASKKVQNANFDPEFLKNLLWDLVKKVAGTKTGVFVNELEDHLLKQYKEETLHQNGIYSANDLLKHADDMVQKINNKVFPKMSAATSALSNKFNELSVSHSTRWSPPDEEEFDEYSSDEDHDDFYDSHYTKHHEESDNPVSDSMNKPINFDLMDEEALSNYTIERLSKSADEKLRENQNNGMSSINEYQGHEDNFSSQMIKNFQKILSKHPDGIWCRDLPQKYFEEVGARLDIQQLGYDSAIKLASCLPSVFSFKRFGNQDFRLYDARTSEHEPNLQNYSEGFKSSEVPYIPSGILNNIKDLLDVHNQGVRSTELRSLYEETFKKTLNIEALGFNKMEDFLKNLKDYITVTSTVFNYCVLTPKHRVLPLVVPKQGDELPISDPIDFISPEDVMKPGDIIAEQSLPDININASAEDPLLSIDIRVAEVISPAMFYIMLDEKYNALEVMMDDLDKFYKLEEQYYKIAQTYVRKDLYCASLYLDFWHRVKVLEVQTNKVKIIYIDYGTPATVKYTELRYLHNDFSKLPAQAIGAKLMGICPCNNEKKWPKESCSRFLEFVENKRLIAHVYEICRPENKSSLQLSIILYDTLKPEQIVINEYLVERGLAEFSYKVDNNSEDNIQVEVDSTSSMNTPTSTSSSNKTLWNSYGLESEEYLVVPEKHNNVQENSFGLLLEEHVSTAKHNNVQWSSAGLRFEEHSPATAKLNDVQWDSSELMLEKHVPAPAKLNNVQWSSSGLMLEKPIPAPGKLNNLQTKAGQGPRPPPGFENVTPEVQLAQMGHVHNQFWTYSVPSPMAYQQNSQFVNGYQMPHTQRIDQLQFFPQQQTRSPPFIPQNSYFPYAAPQFPQNYPLPFQAGPFACPPQPYPQQLPNFGNQAFIPPQFSNANVIPPTDPYFRQLYQSQSPSYSNQIDKMLSTAVLANNSNLLSPKRPTSREVVGASIIQENKFVEHAAQIMARTPVESVEPISPVDVESSNKVVDQKSKKTITTSVEPTCVKEENIDTWTTHNIELSHSSNPSYEFSMEEIENIKADEVCSEYGSKLSCLSKVSDLSSSSDYLSAMDDDRCSSPLRDTKEKSTSIEACTSVDTPAQEFSSIVPDGWEDIDVDDTPAKADNFHIDFTRPLDYLKDSDYCDNIYLSEKDLPKTLNNNKPTTDSYDSFQTEKKEVPISHVEDGNTLESDINSLKHVEDDSFKYKTKDTDNLQSDTCDSKTTSHGNSNLFMPNKMAISTNWKDIFDPDSLSVSASSNRNKQDETKHSSLNRTVTVRKTLIQEINIQNKIFHLLYVNNKLAVLAQEFYPQYTFKNWSTLSMILRVRYNDFPIIYRKDEPELFKKLDSISGEFSCSFNVKKSIKFKKEAHVSYIHEVAPILQCLNVKNEALLNELKILEENFKSSS